MTLDVTTLRAHFPALASGIAFFDAPGGTQTPRVVGEAIASALTNPLTIPGGDAVRSEVNAAKAESAFRSAFGDFLGLPDQGVIYGRSATQLNYDLSRALAKTWGPKDEIVVSRLDHDSNVRPWVQAAESVGATVRWIDFDPATAEIIWQSVDDAINQKTRLVAVTAASNVLGTMPRVRAIADAAHAVGAHLHVDAVHYAAHNLVDVPGLGADSLVCSPYKFLGPHMAVLGASLDVLEALRPDKLRPSSDEVPHRFELGTLPYEIMAGATAAVDFLAEIAPGAATSRREKLRNSFHAIEEHEAALRKQLEEGLAGFGDAVVVHSRAEARTPTTLITLPGRKTWDAYEFLGSRDISAPAHSSFYAYEAFRRLDLDDENAMRFGLAPYVTEAEVSRLLNGLADFLAR
ncbi:cysteine desulfurase-like protein [Salinibacterium sp. G-O1]|uniref:cysteine desulfurase-like protein n=1 Tax=Salinibacterium sp. G-O1 TaxID=3046208 RepID=UPI0024BAA57E|nr:cysteine desulfurase-like protein [Salinibacterium sp. G-O1]MDJ0334938.1 cysteine desulfurase-like protein [Salinibacterium sp. G-O1]